MKIIRRKIFLVDDVAFSLNSIKNRISSHYEVFAVQSVDALFDLLEHVTPDMILLDINMPDTDGFEGIKMLKSDTRYAHIPVIFVTASHDKKNIVKGMSLGAADFVMKPVSTSKLVDGIECQFDPEKREAAKPIVLAVDDHPSILQSIYHMLNDQYRVHTLQEPQEIEQVLKSVTPDLFLLDCQMPGIHGFDLIAIIRGIPAFEKTPVIFITTDATIDNFTVAMYLGACDFIVKPIDATVLREKIAKQLVDYIMERNGCVKMFGGFLILSALFEGYGAMGKKKQE